MYKRHFFISVIAINVFAVLFPNEGYASVAGRFICLIVEIQRMDIWVLQTAQLIHDGVIVRNHEKRWMDETLTLDWIKSIWGKRPGADKVYLRWTLSGATKYTKLSGP